MLKEFTKESVTRHVRLTFDMQSVQVTDVVCNYFLTSGSRDHAQESN